MTDLSEDVLYRSARALGEAVRARRLSPVELAESYLARLERHYLSHPVAGGWYDTFDGEGRSTVATIPASSFYHVLCAVTEADAVLS